MTHIAILDFGSQYTHLIARRIRDLGVLAEIYPNHIKTRELTKAVVGIVLSGGPQSVYDKKSASIDAGIFKLGIPVLGLCYGHQLMAKMLGGQVKEGRIKEYGRADLQIKRSSPLLRGVGKKTRVWMSHGDTVSKLPAGWQSLASTSDCPIAAMANAANNFYGLQFHPEVQHTVEGKKILNNFVLKICRLRRNWKIKNVLKDIVGDIKVRVGKRGVFLLVSGGVDSTVCFALLQRALGKKKIYGLHIDTGFMRYRESEQISRALGRAKFKNLHVFDAKNIFYKKLKNVTNPERKRKIIGQTYLEIKETALKNLGLDSKHWLLGQGTIYPDTIESGGTKHADKIKTHHNRVAAIQKLIKRGRVIEPLANFYKDEVRRIGRLLGLPRSLLWRHPFPGPGLAIRILGQESKSGFIPSASLKTKIGKIIKQSYPSRKFKFSVLPIRSVGVQGDERTYAHPLCLIPTNAGNVLDWEKLDQTAALLANSLRAINRVLLLLNPPFPEAKFQKGATLTQTRIELLQRIDDVVMRETKKNKLYDKIWQFTVALAPLGQKNQESIILRPVSSQEAMTAHFTRLPWNFLRRLTKKIIGSGKIDYVFFDLTNKPPGTIEWE